MDISFIIPIYNTPEEKMKRCFESVNKIKDIRYEVLLIDDGSDNFVGEFCKEYIKLHSEFRYYRVSHTGVSAARNHGIEIATGRYIAFIDSDDYILPEAYNKELVSKKFDLMVFDMEYETGNGGMKYCNVISDKNAGVYENIILFDAIIKNSGAGCPVAKLFSRRVLIEREVKFDEEMQSGEDADFLLQMLLAIDSFIYRKEVVYRYRFSYLTGQKRIIRNPQKAIHSIERGLLKKRNILNKLNVEDRQREDYSVRMNQKVIKSLMHVSGQVVLNKMMNDNLGKQIVNVLCYVDKGSFSTVGMAMIRYSLLIGRHWKIIGAYERVRMIWAGFKYKHIRKY